MVCKYTKPSLTITQQAQLLIDRGLICDDRQRLESYLSSIGYYRLSAYWQPYYSSETEQFSDNISFDKILSLYVFDRKLRLLVIEAIERIEVALRAQWSDNLSTHGGSHAYMDASFFKDHKKHIRNLSKLVTSVDDSKEDFIQHYVSKYDSPALPPIWAIVETMTFGNLSHWFENTKDVAVKKAIMKAFNMPTVDITEKVFHALTPIRNVCAHHSRLWNRKFTMVLPEIKRLRNNLISGSDAHYLYNYLVIIDVLIRAISPRSSWRKRLIDLLDTIEPINHKSMGFPKNWRIKEPWNLKIMNVPALRFKEFSGEWKGKKLKDVFTIKYGKDYKNLSVGDIPVFGTGGIMTYVDQFLYDKPSVLIGRKGTIDKPKFIQQPFWTVDTLFYTEINEEFSPFFIYLLVLKVDWYKFNEATGVPSLNTTAINGVDVSVPTLPEQTKIANFLIAIDDKINQLSQKVDLLSQYKKGVMQQIFSQQLRFKDDDGREFDEWEEKTLEEISTKKSSNIAANKIENNEGNYKIYGAAGVLKNVDFFTQDCSYISIVKDGAGVGRVFLCEPKTSVLGTMDIIQPKENVDISFLYAVLERIDFITYVTGSTIPHIYYKDYSKETICIPSLPEQTKIANFLTAIDDKITQTKNQLEAMKDYKKGLLQQMFV